MVLRSGFFNSINGDRKYDGKRFAEYFSSFIGNGIFSNPSTNLQVIANDDMTVTVKAGKAWINGYILVNDDDYILRIDVADGLLSRIDRIVARYDIVDREIRLEVKKGTFASNPVALELQRDYDAFELGLADILVKKNANSVYQMDITDLRFLSDYCGIVHGLVDQVDVSTIYNQYSQEFRLWLDTLKDALDENAATNLYNMITTVEGQLDLLDADYIAHKADYAAHIIDYAAHIIDIAAHDMTWHLCKKVTINEQSGLLRVDIDIPNKAFKKFRIMVSDFRTKKNGYTNARALSIRLNNISMSSFANVMIDGDATSFPPGEMFVTISPSGNLGYMTLEKDKINTGSRLTMPSLNTFSLEAPSSTFPIVTGEIEIWGSY